MARFKDGVDSQKSAHIFYPLPFHGAALYRVLFVQSMDNSSDEAGWRKVEEALNFNVFSQQFLGQQLWSELAGDMSKRSQSQSPEGPEHWALY